MITTILMFILGLILIIKGGDWFVDSSVSMARISGLPEMLIGATIVSIATTLPEVIVSVTAATQGFTTMSVGNALGSMICNIGLILGISIICIPTKTKGRYFNTKSIVLIFYTALFVVFGINGQIERYEAIYFLMLFVLYLLINAGAINVNKRLYALQNVTVNRKELSKISLFFVLGISSIVLGSNLLISNGTVLARLLGVSEAVISLSLIAFGTSLPELVTALTAIKKKSADIGIGNIIGANIFNVSLVIGASGFIKPLKIIPQNITLDFPVVVVLTAILILPSLVFKKTIKIQGIILLAIYVVYMFFLWSKYGIA